MKFAVVFLAFLGGLLPAHLQAQGKVWVVDAAGGPGAHSATIRDAVLLASSGDMLLVRSGDYGRFKVDGKGLAIVADTGADVVVGGYWGGPTQVVNLPAGETVLLRGLHLTNNVGAGAGSLVPATLSLDNDLGSVWIEDCRIDKGHPSVSISSCASVTVMGCSIEGGNTYIAGISTEINAGNALESKASSVRLYGGELLGQHGFPGTAGAVLDGGSLYAAQTSFVGGVGTDGWLQPPFFKTCSDPHVGGPGLWLKSGAPVAHLLEVQAAGGAGGTSSCGGAAAPGLPIEVDAGAVVVLSGEAVGLDVDSPVREGATLTATATSPPGALVLLAWSVAPADVFLPALAGVLHVAPPVLISAMGTTSSTGTISTMTTVPDLAAGFEGLVLHAQAAA